MRILALDPGNHTGWVLYDTDTKLISGGTLGESFSKVYELCTSADLIVYESFNLYPGMARSLAWNEFYPCQVIGVIKLACEQCSIKAVKQSPSVKKFAGDLNSLFDKLKKNSPNVTEHTKDAFLHLKYYLIQEGFLR